VTGHYSSVERGWQREKANGQTYVRCRNQGRQEDKGEEPRRGGEITEQVHALEEMETGYSKHLVRAKGNSL